jgi:predicted nucleic acid-binding protein
VARAWEFIEALLASPGLSILLPTDRHAAVAGEVFAELPHLAGNVIHDAHTAVLMREHGIRRIYTRDTDFHRFPFLEPIDPTT